MGHFELVWIRGSHTKICWPPPIVHNCCEIFFAFFLVASLIIWLLIYTGIAFSKKKVLNFQKSFPISVPTRLERNIWSILKSSLARISLKNKNYIFRLKISNILRRTNRIIFFIENLSMILLPRRSMQVLLTLLISKYRKEKLWQV